MKKLQIIIAIMLILCFVVPSSFGKRKDHDALVKSLDYLYDISDIQWVEIDRNNVYIGFISKPDDIGSIVRGAALKGNKAYGFGVHVWAMNANDDWQSSSKYYCTASARRGKITSSDCK